MATLNDELHFSVIKLIVPHFQELICEFTKILVVRVQNYFYLSRVH